MTSDQVYWRVWQGREVISVMVHFYVPRQMYDWMKARVDWRDRTIVGFIRGHAPQLLGGSHTLAADPKKSGNLIVVPADDIDGLDAYSGPGLLC